MLETGSSRMIVHTIFQIMKPPEKIVWHKTIAVSRNAQEVYTKTATALAEILNSKYKFEIEALELVLNKKSVVQKGLKFNPDSSECLQDTTCKRISEKTLKHNILDIATNPAHIIDETQKLNPSAFIPFCAFSGQNLGTNIKEFSEPVCSNFQQIIFEGRVCYKFQVDKKKQKVHQGRAFGLKLLVDFNQDRTLSLNPETDDHEDNSNISNMFQDIESDDRLLHPEKDITVHINTILPYTAVGGGVFKLSGIKQIETTADFEKLDVSAKRCQELEFRSQCLNRVLHAGAFEFCQCCPVYIQKNQV